MHISPSIKLCAKLSAALGVTFFLTGCSIVPKGYQSEKLIDAHQAHSEEILSQLQNTKHSNTRRLQVPWVSKKPCDQIPIERLPKNLNVPVVLSLMEPTGLTDVMTYVQKISGVGFRITADAEAKLKGNLNLATESAGKSASRKTPLFQSSSGKNADSDEGASSAGQLVQNIRYQGNLEGLMDTIASTLNLSWRYEGNQILFYYLNTRTFSLYAIPSNVKINATVSSNMSVSSGGGKISAGEGSGQSNQTTSVSMDTDILADLTENIALMITPGVGRYYAAQATGSVTVVDTDDVLKRIGEYIDSVNKLLTKQVILNVKVLSLDFKNEDQYEINWSLLYKAANQSSGQGENLIGWTTVADSQGKPQPPSRDDNEGLFSASGNLPIPVLTNPLAVSVFIKALSEQAKVSVLTSPSVTTLNLQPVPVQVAEQEAYVARVTSTTGDTSDQTTYTYETDTITSGLSMNLLPFLMENNQLLLQYSLSLSDLLSKTEVGTDAMKLQLPKVSNKIFSQKVKLRSGQTLVLSGFEQHKSSTSQNGPVNDNLWLLGGKSSGGSNRSGLIILINPIILE